MIPTLGRQRQAELCECEGSLICLTSSRPAKATQCDFVLKTKKQKKKKKRKTTTKKKWIMMNSEKLRTVRIVARSETLGQGRNCHSWNALSYIQTTKWHYFDNKEN